MTTTPAERVYSALRAIPKGKVTSYGKLASYAQLPKSARFVGRILSQLPNDTALPWHRVVKADGALAFPPNTMAFKRQKALLTSECIVVIKNKVNMTKFCWHP